MTLAAVGFIHTSRRRKNGFGIVQFTRETGNRLKTKAAKTRGLDAIGCEPAQNVIRHKDFLAPTGSFVEMPFRHAAPIVASTPGTLFVASEAKAWRPGQRRFIVRSRGFHKIPFELMRGYTIYSGDLKRHTCNSGF